MATWKISNYHKKNAVERTIWTKDGTLIIKDEGFRWGHWTCESNERPNVDLNNPDGYELMATDYDWEMDEMIDGSWQEWTWADNIDEQERERIQSVWDDELYEGMESDGWIHEDTEHWIFGPIELTNVDTGEAFHGEE